MSRNMARILLRMKVQGTNITVNWTERVGATLDKISGSYTGGTETAMTKVYRGFFHEVGPATSGFRVYQEVEIGNAIVDLPPDAVVDGLTNVSFTIDGRTWVQKEVGEKLAQAWDVVWNNQRVTRTLLLRRAT